MDIDSVGSELCTTLYENQLVASPADFYELNAEKLGKRSLKKMKKDENLAAEQEEWFGLSEEEVADIYDQIEMDDKNE